MKTTTEHVQEILWRSGSPALPLPRVLDELERHTVTGGPDAVLRELRSDPDRFCVLNPRVGPWRSRSTAIPAGWTPDLWILGLRPHGTARSPGRAILSASVRSLGRRLDRRSATATARWLVLMEG